LVLRNDVENRIADFQNVENCVNNVDFNFTFFPAAQQQGLGASQAVLG
jgi:hypothetical protein